LKRFKISDHKFHGRHIHQDGLCRDLTRPDPQQSFSCHRLYQSSSPVSTALLEKNAEEVIRHAGQRSAVEGIIPGHLKLLIKSDNSGLILSMTRPDSLDKAFLGQWSDLSDIKNYEVTINFNLVIPAVFSEEEYLEALTPGNLTEA